MHRLTDILSGSLLRARFTLSLDMYGQKGSGRRSAVFDSFMMPSVYSCR